MMYEIRQINQPPGLPKIQNGAKLCEMEMLTIMVIALAKNMFSIIVKVPQVLSAFFNKIGFFVG